MLLLCSCSNFLSEESQDEVIVRTVADYSELLFGSGYPDPGHGEYNILYALDDDYQISEKALYSDHIRNDALTLYPFFSWQPNMWQYDVGVTSIPGYNNAYSESYERIMGVNAVLDGIDGAINGTKENQDIVKAEALGLRGYYYFMLTNIFGEPYCYNKQALGVPLKLTADIEPSGLTRQTVEQCYSQILSDLTGSADLFRNYTKRRGSYRLNLPAVDILLSRVYLQMEDWDKVIEVASEAIKTGGALTDYSVLSVEAGGSYQPVTTYNNSEVEVVFGCGNDGCTLGCLMLSADLSALYFSTDYRKTLWFDANGNVRKNRLYNDKTAPSKTIRTSEAYLARAEAYAKKGMTSEALADLNHLRQYRYRASMANRTMAMPATADALIDSIRVERRRELCFDEVRWFDLRRYGMPQILHRYKNLSTDAWKDYVLKEKDPLYTLPIPNDAIVANPGLVQNACANEPAR